MVTENGPPPKFEYAVPKELGVPPDQLRCRLDFFHQAVVMTLFEGDVVKSKLVSAVEVAHSLANDLSFGTGLLPPRTIWWRNTRAGPMYAFYVEPAIYKIALEIDARKAPRRYTLPLPGLIFLCIPGQAPWVYAVKKKPTKESDIVFKAPLANIHEDGRSCPGTHHYPTRAADMVRSFFLSFFTATANLSKRSKKFPKNIVQLWDFLDGKKHFPKDDLVEHSTLGDIMNMEINV